MALLRKSQREAFLSENGNRSTLPGNADDNGGGAAPKGGLTPEMEGELRRLILQTVQNMGPELRAG